MIRLALLLILLGSQVFAQAPLDCAQRERMVERLKEKYGETRHSTGLANGNRFMEFFADTVDGSWTILLTDTQGISCIMLAGHSYASERPPADL